MEPSEIAFRVVVVAVVIWVVCSVGIVILSWKSAQIKRQIRDSKADVFRQIMNAKFEDNPELSRGGLIKHEIQPSSDSGEEMLVTDPDSRVSDKQLENAIMFYMLWEDELTK